MNKCPALARDTRTAMMLREVCNLSTEEMILEATDLNHAIRLLSNHPSVRLLREKGSWEIRPAADLTVMIEESERRREM